MKNMCLSVLFVVIMAHIAKGGIVCSSDSASVSIDTYDEPELDSIVISWDSAWIGGNSGATVVITDNGEEVKRVAGAGDFSYSPPDIGRHVIKYTTYIDDMVQDEIYEFTMYKGWKYERSDNGVIITETTQKSGAVIIPSEIDGCRVTDIGNGVFWGCSALTRITLPDGVTRIGDSAFNGCSGLTSVTIPNSVLSIGAGAFSGCSGLTSITLPFVGSKRGNTGSADSLFGYIFGSSSYSGGEKVNQNYNSLSYKKYYIPLSLKTVNVTDETMIGYGAFYGCSGLTSVTIPNSVTSIGVNAFSGCRGLSDILLPNSVMNIGDEAFAGCANLERMTLPFIGSRRGDNTGAAAVFGYTFGDEEFQGGTKAVFTYLTGSGTATAKLNRWLPRALKSVTITDETLVARGAFDQCSSLTNIVLNEGITYIGEFAFCNNSFESINIPNSVSQIDKNAFSGCGSLTSVAIPNSVMSIEEGAFSGCGGLTSITIPFIGSKRGNTGSTDSVFGYIFGSSAFEGGGAKITQHYDGPDNSPTVDYYVPMTLKSVTVTDEERLGYGAFYGLSGLTDLSINAGVREIGGYAFRNCAGLAEFVLPNGISEIEVGVFRGCSGLNNLSIHDGVTRIASYAFSECSGLSNVILSDGVTSIGESAFSGCSNLTSVTIPDSVTRIGANAFRDCNSLSEVHVSDLAAWCSVSFADNPLKYAHNLYLNGELIAQVVIPSGVTSIESNAFWGCSNLTSVTLPDSVTSIGANAFLGCDSLTEVHVSDIAAWCSVSFADNPLKYAHNLHLNGELITQLTIPSGVTGIAANAFSGCSGLTSVTLPDGMTSIGDNAFSGCSGLLDVLLPDSVMNIGDKAFAGCANLESMTLPFIGSQRGDNTGAAAVFGYIFGDEEFQGGMNVVFTYLTGSGTATAKLDRWLPATLKCIVITDETLVARGAFDQCSSLTNIVLNEGITYVGAFAFCNNSFVSINIPDSVTQIDKNAFSGCGSLTSVTIPNSVLSIGAGAFSGCSGLTSITLPFVGSKRGNTGSADSLFGYIFGSSSYSGGEKVNQNYNSSSYNTYYIPLSLKTVNLTDETMIGYGAFYGCDMLDAVALGSVKSIGGCAFFNCGSLLNVTTDGCVESIDKLAFSGCNNLIAREDGYIIVEGWLVGYSDNAKPSISDVDELRGIAGGALDGCTAINMLEFSDKAAVSYIGAAALKGCTELRSLVLPPSLEVIGDEAFMGCSYLSDVIIPGGVKSIGARAFKNCTGFTNAQIEYGVESLGEEAFCGDWQIKEVDIPSTVRSIGKNAFGGDSSIIRVGLRGDIRTVAEIFSNYKIIREATVKEGTGAIVDGLFTNCTQLADVRFFGNCPALKNNGANLYNGTKSNLKTYVSQDSTGWDGTPGSHQLPQAWPLTGNYRKAIAYWNVPTYLVEFDSNGGTLGVQSTYQYSERKFSLPPEPVQTGYTFAGWWTKPSGGLQVTADTVFIEGVYRRLYAHWTKGHWVFLDPNGGTVANDFVTYVEQSVYGVLPAAVRTGYAFGGWEYNGQTVLPSTPISTSADHTLKAQWEAYEYSIRFNASGGDGEMASLAMEYDASKPLTENAFAKQGYAFAGWTVSEGGTVVFHDGEVVSNLTAERNGVVDLYAVWEKDGSNVSFVSVGAAEWVMDSETRHDGAISWRSGAIGDNEESVLMTKVKGPGKVSFWWKVGCESFKSLRLDNLAFAIDGEEQTWINGNKDWSCLEYDIEGEGDHTLVWTYAKDESDSTDPDCGWVSEVVWEPSLETFNDYLNCSDLEFSSVGNPWYGEKDVSHDGFGALRSCAIGDDAESRLETTVDGAGTISFWWRTDCEASFKTYILDHLSFFVDGVEVGVANGETEWKHMTVTINGSGQHALAWVYAKDEDGYVGEDCAWLDEVVWTPRPTIPAIAIDAAAEEVEAAVESVGFTDEKVREAIGGSAEEYVAFKTWAEGVEGGAEAVVDSEHAAASYLLGAAALMENEPTVEFSDVEIGGDSGEESEKGTITLSVTVKDGENAVAVASEKVANMFEATSDLGDWAGEAKLTPTVEVLEGEGNTMRFKVKPGDGKSPSVFLRIRK